MVRSAVFVGPPRRSSAAGLQNAAGEQVAECILTPSGPPEHTPTDTSVKQQALPRLGQHRSCSKVLDSLARYTLPDVGQRTVAAQFEMACIVSRLLLAWWHERDTEFVGPLAIPLASPHGPPVVQEDDGVAAVALQQRQAAGGGVAGSHQGPWPDRSLCLVAAS